MTTPSFTSDGTTVQLLVIDDDAEMSEVLARLLKAEGYNVETATSAQEALSAFTRTNPALVLLDVALGTDDGRDLLIDIRAMSDVPVVFLTGRGHEMDRIAGLKMGADDYVVKPFSPGELIARVESLLRRTRPKPTPPKSMSTADELAIDRGTREVFRHGEPVELTAKEFDLLAFLANSPRQVFSRSQLLDHVWDSSSEWQDESTVTEHIRRIRRKIEVDSDHPKRIVTVRGVGYRFEPPAATGRPS